MDWGSVIGMISQVAGSQAGQAASAMDRDEVMRLIKSVSDEYGKIDVPQLQKLIGQQQGPTQLAGIHDDATYRDQQNSADAQLNDVVNSGGETLSDAAALNGLRNKISRTESAGRHAIEGSRAARGNLDSGDQLAMELQGNQQAAQLANDAGSAEAGRMDARHFEAIRERARNAGTGLDRTYNQKANAARAQDVINAGNAAIANTTARYNAGLPQQNFNNQMSLANAKAQPAYALAGAHGAQAQDTKDQWNKLGNIGAAAANKAGSGGDGSSSNTGNTAAGGGAGGGYDVSGNDTSAVGNSFSSGGATGAAAGSSSDPLSSASTRPGSRVKEVLGEDENGQPVYGYRKANP